MRWLVLLTLGSVLVCGCAATKPAPIALVPPTLPAVEALAVPVVHEPVVPVVDESPLEAIHHANTKALISPTRADFARAVVRFRYQPGALYRIDTAVQQPTDILLQSGERVLAFANGEERWKYQVTEETDPVHIILMPTRPKLKTRMLLHTTLAVYYLELRSHQTTGLTGVSWKHPQPRTTTTGASAIYGVGYGVSGVTGVSWRPAYVWDNGKQTFLLFPEQMRHTQAPTVTVMRGETTAVVNYRVHGRLYIVDRWLDGGEELELRVSAEEDRFVRVVRLSEYAYIHCPTDHEACGVIQRWPQPQPRRTAEVSPWP